MCKPKRTAPTAGKQMHVSNYIQQWLSCLQDARDAAAPLLMIAALILMLFGWRLWKVCVIFSFGLIGAGLGGTLAGESSDQWYFVLIGAVVLGFASYLFANLAIGALGGLIGVCTMLYFLTQLNLSDSTLWALSGAGLLTGAAYSLLYRQHLIVLVTSFLGALLLLSGFAAVAMSSPGIMSTIRSMASSSGIVVPFLILVPTVMSSFYQVSDMRRTGTSVT